jgi:site-specific DNA-methyltransferase (cytosine-N4-specific)
MAKGRAGSGEPETAPLFAETGGEGAEQGKLPIDALAAAATEVVPVRAGAKRSGASRQLPFSKQFSASQIPSLGRFLDVVADATGDAARVQSAVLAYLRPSADPNVKPFQTMAYNALVSATYYGLVTEDRTALTPFGQAVRQLASDDERVDALARHILRNLNGAEVVLGIEELKRAERRLKKDEVAAHFAAQGLASNADGTDINAITGWLRAAGLYEGDIWSALDEALFADLAGLKIEAVAEIADVDRVGLAILEELALAAGYASTTGEMRRLLMARGGLRVNVPNFVKAHLAPLEKLGFISVEKATSGRGGSSARFTGTAKFENEVVQRLLERVRESGITVTGPELQVPFATLVAQLDDQDRNARGRALELFALRLLHHLGLRQIRWRTRPTNAEEIDGSAEGEAQIHTRWQVQCKNTATLEVDDAAKEVGIAVRNRSTIILLVTTGRLSRAANDYVDGVVRYSPYTVLRLEGPDVRLLAGDESKLIDVLTREAARSRNLRSSDVAGQ